MENTQNNNNGSSNGRPKVNGERPKPASAPRAQVTTKTGSTRGRSRGAKQNNTPKQSNAPRQNNAPKQNNTPNRNNARQQNNNVPTVKIIPLGGIGEIGKNMTAIVFGDDIIVIDSGLMFPREEQLGVDYVIPDTTFLKNNIDKVRAIFLTHGHEDHIGGLPYVLRDFNVPVYGSTLTIALCEEKLSEHPDVSANLVGVKAGDKITEGVFTVEFILVSHSIDDAMGLAIKTPIGTIVHTGDFKIDFTPVGGKIMDLNRFAELGKKGVLALMSDSTNAERQGFTMSESQVGETFVNYFRQAKGRIIVASFASNVHRLQQVIDNAKLFNRKICLSGRSMIKVVNVTREIGYLNIDDDMIVGFDDLKNLRDNQVVVLTTGSQGETMSGLVRMATGQHNKFRIKEGDLVIISASPIPGNERYVSDVVNLLYRQGANVINDAMDMVHVSGHACREELKLMLSLVQPKYFIPVHGEYRHLYNHADLAARMGIKEKNIFITEIGKVIELNRKSGIQRDSVTSGSVLIDGLGVGDVGNVVLRDRKLLASDGLFIIVVTISEETGELITAPDLITRGFVYMKESEDLLNRSREIVERVVNENFRHRTSEWSTLKNAIKKEINAYLYGMTNRNPMILPIIIEV